MKNIPENTLGSCSSETQQKSHRFCLLKENGSADKSAAPNSLLDLFTQHRHCEYWSEGGGRGGRGGAAFILIFFPGEAEEEGWSTLHSACQIEQWRAAGFNGPQCKFKKRK